MINATQKDPGQLILTGDRYTRTEHQIIFPRTMESDMKLVVVLELQLMEALKARVQRELDHVINHLRMLADGTPSARYSPDAILHDDKTIL